MNGFNEKEVFLEALGLPPEERGAFLRRACPDAGAVTRIEALLRGHEAGGEPPSIVSEFVDGTTLAAEIEGERERRLAGTSTFDARSWHRRCAEIAAAIGDALEACHRAGIVHRDVKPSNILLDRERGPRLTDRGIAKQLAAETRAAASDPVGGIHYRSPEQVTAAKLEIDGRSDIFSLGVVLYELLTLRRPFEGSDPTRVLAAVLDADPPTPISFGRRVPRDLETICLKALEKDRARRYQHASDLAADLRAHLRGEPISAQSLAPPRRLWRWIRRSRARRTVAMAVVASPVAFAGLGLWRAVEREAMAWVAVDGPRGAQVIVQRYDPVTLGLGPASQLAVVPCIECVLPPGRYRITIVDGSDFAEFDEVLERTGSVAMIHLRATRPGVAPTPEAPLRAWHVATLTARVDADMVVVAAGSYRCDPNDPAASAGAGQPIAIESFAIDRDEVTNGEYARYLAETGAPPPFGWELLGADPALADHPVVGVTREEAAAFARWEGKRLPTAPEWEAAACGTAATRFPWGDGWVDEAARLEPDPGDAIEARALSNEAMAAAYRAHIVPEQVADPLTTANGLRHAFDNVEEITSSLDASGEQVNKGRSWADPAKVATLHHATTAPAGTVSLRRGFRCARTIQPPRVVS